MSGDRKLKIIKIIKAFNMKASNVVTYSLAEYLVQTIAWCFLNVNRHLKVCEKDNASPAFLFFKFMSS